MSTFAKKQINQGSLDKRLSRKLTVDAHEPYISIRSVIKKADKEAAYTLCEAYQDDPILNWLTGSIKDRAKRLELYQDIFKSLIRAAVRKSREFAVQVNGCKGVLIWSESSGEPLTLANVLGKRKLWSSINGLSVMRASFVHHRGLSKARKRLLDGRRHITIHYVGVLPAERRHNLGNALVRHVLNKADDVQMPVFVELWGPNYVSWFERLGFQVKDRRYLSSDGELPVFYLVREPLAPHASPLSSEHHTLHLEPPREDTLEEAN
ncbi:hypothetical protein CLU79DRAFT_749799 [Phycomyces nitens]|nr:hypothetical protein CLU79DRAFT_749799 [Phycomyces nitens]